MRAFPVRLPSGTRYWTVLDEDLRVVPVADGFLRHAEATPSKEEITRIRRLINRIKGDLAGLGTAEKAGINEAIAVLPRPRAVSLGMPAIRPGTSGVPPAKDTP